LRLQSILLNPANPDVLREVRDNALMHGPTMLLTM
jgi:hypothetical protein